MNTYYIIYLPSFWHLFIRFTKDTFYCFILLVLYMLKFNRMLIENYNM